MENTQERQELKPRGKGSLIFFSALTILFLIFAGLSYWRFYVDQDFLLYSYVDCDPATESCFIYECDPAYDDWCVEDPEDAKENIWPYKFFFKSAKDTPRPEDANCDPIEAQDCPLIECTAGDPNCELLCDPAVDGTDTCIGPGDAFFIEQAEDEEGMAIDADLAEDETLSEEEDGGEASPEEQ